MRFADTPNRFIAMNAKSNDSGITEAVISAARTFRRNRNRISTTSRPPSARFRKTVSVVRSTTSPWL
jgi:hypothetical protein